jgi:hypothetical protein
MSDKKCESLEHPNLEPSWICCQCNPKTMNSNARTHCKECDHKRCDSPKVVHVMALRGEEESTPIPVKIDKSRLN